MIINIEEDPRHAGQITRYHTWPTLRKQSVAEHTWQVMRIMMTISAELCSAKLLSYAVLHDVGEMAGDIPWPGKRSDPILKDRMDAAEERVRRAMTARWSQPSIPVLSETEQSFFKMCECIEMWEYGLQEQNLGNKYGTVVATRMLLAACEYMSKMHPDVRAAARRYVDLRREQESEVEPCREDGVLSQIDKRGAG